MNFGQLARRLASPFQVAAVLVGVGVSAAVVLVGILTLLFDRRARLVRIGLLGLAYAGLELFTLAGYVTAWAIQPLKGRAWRTGMERRLLAGVLDCLYRAGRRLVGFRVVVEDPPSGWPLGDQRPILVLGRHGGFGDSFALVWLLVTRWGRRPRVVLKRMLLAEPLIDVALNRFGACFLRSGSPDRAVQMGTLASSLGSDDALLVFPEGGNWTPRRRASAVWRLWARGHRKAAHEALLMEHVLPPRPAGVAACLDARPELAVVVVAHTGLDSLTTVAAVWRALPFRVPMTVRWWSPPPAPTTEPERLAWLTTQWAIVDEWIDVRLTSPSPAVTEPASVMTGSDTSTPSAAELGMATRRS